jgi:hypothetical protein
MLDGLVRISSDQFYKHGLPDCKKCDVWFDHVLYDIPETVLGAAKSAVAVGVKAITIYEPLLKLRSLRYGEVIDYCQQHNLTIVGAGDPPDYQRRLFWQPE